MILLPKLLCFYYTAKLGGLQPARKAGGGGGERSRAAKPHGSPNRRLRSDCHTARIKFADIVLTGENETKIQLKFDYIYNKVNFLSF